VVELQHAAYALEAELIGFDGIPPLHDTIEDVLTHDIEWLGAFAAGRLVGGLGYADHAGFRDIDRLFVDPQHAGRGIGRSLVSSVLDTAEVRVSTGTGNEPARRLYRSLGFKEIGVRRVAPEVTITLFVRRSGARHG
jgi:GNAT superfamily N-acetyltransferase